MKRKFIALIICLSFLPNVYAYSGPVTVLENAEAPGLPKATVSSWAEGEIVDAYKLGLVSTDFDLGADYTKNISREQFARLAVEFAATEQKTTVRDMLKSNGIQLEIETQEIPPESGTADPEGTTLPESGATDPEGMTPPENGTTDPEDATPPESGTTDPEGTAITEISEPANMSGTVKLANLEGTDSDEPDQFGMDTDNTSLPADVSTTEPGSDVSDVVPVTGPAETDTHVPEPDLSNVLNGSFSDTADAYVELAAKLGIVQGANGLFRPAAGIQRAEAAAMLQRTLRLLNVTEADSAPLEFSDYYIIPRWAVESVKFVSGRTDGKGQSLMGGSGGKFDPASCYTIEQSIITMLRMHMTLAVANTYDSWREAPGYDSVSLTLTFGGDCTFGRGRDFSYSGSFDEMYANHKNDLSYFFSGIPEFYDDDITMVNFEGTLTNSTKYADKTFVFKGPAEYAKILPAGSIDVVSVANNHSKDYLQQGYEDTLKNLTPYVKVSGYEHKPIIEVRGVKVGFASNVGWTYDNAQKNFIDNAIADLKKAGADIIVFNYHWGVERSYKSNATQKAIGHYCIDKGADLVIGHHPHVVQEVEVYKGKPIAYSLGNLVFGGNHNPAEKNCLIFRQNITLDLNTRKASNMQHQALKYRVSSVNSRNDYHPVKAK